MSIDIAIETFSPLLIETMTVPLSQYFDIFLEPHLLGDILGLNICQKFVPYDVILYFLVFFLLFGHLHLSINPDIVD